MYFGTLDEIERSEYFNGFQVLTPYDRMLSKVIFVRTVYCRDNRMIHAALCFSSYLHSWESVCTIKPSLVVKKTLNYFHV